MTRSTLRIPLLAALLALLVPAAALAGDRGFGPGPGGHGGPGGPGGPGGHGPHMLRMLHDLDLTAAQQEQVKALAEEARKTVEPLLDQLRAGREAFRAAHDPGTFDEAALRAQLKKDAAIHEEIAVVEARTASKAYALLTDAQKAELKARRDRHRHGDDELD